MQPMKIIIGVHRSSLISRSDVSVAAKINPLFHSDIAVLRLNTVLLRV
jgi:hypothetical protein